MVADSDILQIIQNAQEHLEKACKNLVNAANEKGGLDNITVVLLKFTP